MTSACASGTCTNPTNAIPYPVAVPAAAAAPPAVKFFNAAANSGLGKFTITPTVGVIVPQSRSLGRTPARSRWLSSAARRLSASAPRPRVSAPSTPGRCTGAVSRVCASTCTSNPTNWITYPVTIPAASPPPTAVKFYEVAADTGQGTFTITPNVDVTAPQDGYTSTLTLAIISRP